MVEDEPMTFRLLEQLLLPLTMPLLLKIKQCAGKIPPKYVYHSGGILSLISIILVSFGWYIVSNKQQSAIYVGKRYGIDIYARIGLGILLPGKVWVRFCDYTLYLYLPKIVELMVTLFAWLTSLKSSWKKTAATTFFIATNMSAVILLLIPIYGTFYAKLCRPVPSCSLRGYFKPIIFLPSCFALQLLTVCVLSFCTHTSNQDVLPVGENKNSNQGRILFCFFFGHISTINQLFGLFIMYLAWLVFFLIAGVWLLLNAFNSREWTAGRWKFDRMLGQWNWIEVNDTVPLPEFQRNKTNQLITPLPAFYIPLLCLFLLMKLVLLATVVYGYKKQKHFFILASSFISVLGCLLAAVSLVSFFCAAMVFQIDRIRYITGRYGINPGDGYGARYQKINGKWYNLLLFGNIGYKCQFIYICHLFFSMEIESLRSLFLLYKYFKMLSFPIEFSDKLLRIPLSKIKCIRLLGKGQFGDVWFGKLKLNVAKNRTNAYAAIKRLKTSATHEMKCWFFEEAILLSRFDHENIIRPIGLCMDSKPVMFCMEHLDGGSVLDYLLKESNKKHLSNLDLTKIILQIAKACIYLESEGYIHRDIAARNCLISCRSVNGNKKPKVVKLADFGLAKDVKSRYQNIYKKENPLIPIPNTAPEGLSGNFYPKSDVWSFAVFVWEVFSWCAKPYGKCHASNGGHTCLLHEYTNEEIEIIVKVNHKTLLDFADPCTNSFTESLKNFLVKCWKYEQNERPDFQQILSEIEEFKKNCSNSPCFPFQKIKQLNNTKAAHSSTQFVEKEIDTRTTPGKAYSASDFFNAECNDRSSSSGASHDVSYACRLTQFQISVECHHSDSIIECTRL